MRLDKQQIISTMDDEKDEESEDNQENGKDE